MQDFSHSVATSPYTTVAKGCKASCPSPATSAPCPRSNSKSARILSRISRLSIPGKLTSPRSFLLDSRVERATLSLMYRRPDTQPSGVGQSKAQHKRGRPFSKSFVLQRSSCLWSRSRRPPRALSHVRPRQRQTFRKLRPLPSTLIHRHHFLHPFSSISIRPQSSSTSKR